MMRFGQITFLAACSAALVPASLPAAAQQAPSFDCGKATARIEQEGRWTLDDLVARGPELDVPFESNNPFGY